MEFREIRDLANRLHRDVEEVRLVYEREFARLDAQSRVKTYLPVLASRATLDLLQSRPH